METCPANPLAHTDAKLSLVNTTTTRFLFWQPRPQTVIHLHSGHTLNLKLNRTCILDNPLTKILLCLRDLPAILFLNFFSTTTCNSTQPVPHFASATASTTVLESIITNSYLPTRRTEQLFASCSFRKNNNKRSYISSVSRQFLACDHLPVCFRTDCNSHHSPP